jgi:hypothetical protein
MGLTAMIGILLYNDRMPAGENFSIAGLILRL